MGGSGGHRLCEWEGREEVVVVVVCGRAMPCDAMASVPMQVQAAAHGQRLSHIAPLIRSSLRSRHDRDLLKNLIKMPAVSPGTGGGRKERTGWEE